MLMLMLGEMIGLTVGVGRLELEVLVVCGVGGMGVGVEGLPVSVGVPVVEVVVGGTRVTVLMVVVGWVRGVVVPIVEDVGVGS